MKPKIEIEIAGILNNSELSVQERCNSLRRAMNGRCGENRSLIFVVIEILDCFHLPLKIVEQITIHDNYQISDRNFGYLTKILRLSENHLFNAICAEILWIHTHQKEYANIAIYNYNSLIESTNNDYLLTQLFVSVCRIYSKYQVEDYDYESFFCKALEYTKSRYSVKDYCNDFILTALSRCNRHLQDIKETYYSIIEYYEKEKDYIRASNYIESLLSIKDVIDAKEKKTLIVRIAQNYESAADKYDWNDPANSHNIIHLIHVSMNWWDKIDDLTAKKARKRLSRSIEPIKKLALETMHPFSTEIDISEWITNTKEYIRSNSFNSVLFRFTKLLPLENIDTIFECYKSKKEYASQLFNKTILDKEGRIRCIVPVFSRKEDHYNQVPFFENQAKEKYDFYIGFLTRYLYYFKTQFEISSDDIEFIFENNILIPLDRKSTVVKGIMAGFQYDFATSIHLLMPQIENAIRHLAIQCGAVVYKTDKNGIESSLSLESILSCEEICNCLDETLLFNLRLFYTSPYGYGMRNELCHGFLSDEELNSSLGFIVWYFTLRLCCIFSPQCLRLGYFSMHMDSNIDS